MQKIIDAIVAWLESIFPIKKPADVTPIKIAPTPPVVKPVDASRPSDLPESNHYASSSLTLLSREYDYLWPLIQVTDKWKAECSDFAKKAIAKKASYQIVAKAIGCPWWFIAVIHYREASLDWNANLANGDPYDEETVHYPTGRGPFDSWADAAIDALKYEGYADRVDWGFAQTCYRLEAYNGLGYRSGGIKDFELHIQGSRVGTYNGVYHGSMQDTTPRNASPYMYCGTQFYVKGVSIEDHSFYPDAHDDQPGCFPLMKALEMAGEKIV